MVLDYFLIGLGDIMLSRTKSIRNEMLTLSDSYDRLKLLKNKYQDKTAYIVGTGPSLRDHNIDELKEFLSDKFVLGIKQAHDVLGDIVDIHLMNFCNYKHYEYNEDIIVSWIVYMQDQPYYIIENNIRCDFMMPLTRNWGSHNTTIAAQRDFDSLLIDNSFERPWGSGIMYESGLPIALYTGCKKIVTIGWDIGNINENDKGKKLIKYDHFYADGGDMRKTEYDGVNVQKGSPGGSSGMSYDETKMVVDSTEDLHYFLEGIGVELNICSTINPAYEKIKRVKLYG